MLFRIRKKISQRANARKQHNLKILGYHSVTDVQLPLNDWCHLDVSEFNKQMRWLADQSVDILPLNEAVNAMLSGSLSRDSVAITFDDGFRNNVTVALPILQELRLPATIFLTTGPTDRRTTLWPNRIISALARTKKKSIHWHGEDFGLVGQRDRQRANAGLQAMVKTYCPANPESATLQIEQLLDVSEEVEIPLTSPYSMLLRRDIDNALTSGLISFGAHTVTHPILSGLDCQKMATEIIGSIKSVEEFTGQQCISFAYPNGRDCDFDDRAINILRQNSIHFAVTAVEGPNRTGGDPFRLRRWLIGNSDGLREFRDNLFKT